MFGGRVILGGGDAVRGAFALIVGNSLIILLSMIFKKGTFKMSALWKKLLSVLSPVNNSEIKSNKNYSL